MAVAAAFGCLWTAVLPVRAQTQPASGKPERTAPVIVLDPGHGGENLGMDRYPDHLEKELTLELAGYVKEELEKYGNITVVLTRNSDVDMSLRQRVEAAAAADADYLISLHFNQSVHREICGAEAWIPSKRRLYLDSYPMADNCLRELNKLGLVNRGVKTMVNDEGTDYYGILREADKVNLPAMILEHCFLDSAYDSGKWETEGARRKLAQADAAAIAKTLGLSSGGAEADLPERVYQDTTPPEEVRAWFAGGRLGGVVGVEAQDEESRLIYYRYSLDGGRTWSAYKPWQEGANLFFLSAKAIKNLPREGQAVIRVYNGYDCHTDFWLRIRSK